MVQVEQLVLALAQAEIQKQPRPLMAVLEFLQPQHPDPHSQPNECSGSACCMAQCER